MHYSTNKLFVFAFFIVGALLTILIYSIGLTGPVLKSDGEGYYIYLPSFFIHEDLNSQDYMQDKFEAYDFEGVEHTVNGQVLNQYGEYFSKYPIGVAILQAPFFVVADVLTQFTGLPRTGFSPIYQIVVGGSALFYFAASLMILLKIFQRYFDRKDYIFPLTALILGTNLLHYVTFDGSFSHIYSFFLFACFYYLYFKVYVEHKWDLSLFLSIGLVSGLIVVTRPTNIFLPLIFLAYYFLSRLFYDYRSKLKEIIYRITLTAIGTFVPLIPQIIYWYANTGNFISYSYGEEGFNFLEPAIVNVLFGSRRGIVWWSPVAFLGILGLIFFLRKTNLRNLSSKTKQLKDKLHVIIILTSLFTFLNLFITSSWWTWYYGGSFGYRPITESFVLLLLPLVLLYRTSYRKVIHYLLVFFMITTTILMLLYWLGNIPSEGPILEIQGNQIWIE